MNEFGADLKKPNLPKVPICTSGNLIAWAWGRDFHVFSRTESSEVFTSTESTIITALAAAGPHWAIVTDGRKMILRRREDGQIDESFFLHRRLAAVSYGLEGRFLMADKFGDVSDLTLEEVRQASESAAKLVATHAAKNPEDSVFSKKNEAALRSVEAEPLTAEEERREAEREILFTSLSGHLATITQAGFVDITCKDGVRRPFVLACDRDEKIRLSRYPEIWIIQSIFCGHREFVADMLVYEEAEHLPLLVSAGADMTLRCWRVCDGQEIATLALDRVPFRLLQLDKDLRVFHCGTTLTSAYRLCDGLLQQTSEIDLPAIPVAVAVGDDGEFHWLDLSGNLRFGMVGDIVHEAASTSERPHFVRHWKHTREEGVMSAEERRAKRLKGTKETHNGLLTQDELHDQDDTSVNDNEACEKN